MEALSVRIPDDLDEEIREYCEKKGVSRSVAARRLLEDGFSPEEEEYRVGIEAKDTDRSSTYWMFIIGLFMALLYEGARIAEQAPNPGTVLEILGLVALLYPAIALFVQAVTASLNTTNQFDKRLAHKAGIVYVCLSLTVIASLGYLTPELPIYIIAPLGVGMFVVTHLSAQITHRIYAA